MGTPALYRAFQLSLRAGIGAGLSAALAGLVGLQFPLYAFIAAVIVTDLSPSRTRQLGLTRIAATVVGAGCGALLVQVLEPGPWVLALGVFLAMQACHIVKLQEGSKVAGYICAIVMYEHAGHAWSYALYRLIETMLGIGIATAISLVPKLIRIEEEERQFP